ATDGGQCGPIHRLAAGWRSPTPSHPKFLRTAQSRRDTHVVRSHCSAGVRALSRSGSVKIRKFRDLGVDDDTRPSYASHEEDETMLRNVAFAIALTGIGVSLAGAACTPFGGDDTGCLTADKVKSKCEQKVQKNVVTAVAGVIKCHKKAADAAVQSKPFDEDGCEAGVLSKFTSKTDTTNCPCVDKNGLAATIETVVDGNNALLYCDPAGLPFGGDDTGTVPSTKTILGCEDKLGKCVSLLAKGYGLCHQHAAQDFVHGT